MRQAGFLAAAGIYALDHHVSRLSTDHQHAAALADALNKVNYVSSVMPVQTNIVLFNVAPGFRAEDVVHLLSEKGIACIATSLNTIRMVTHLDVSSEMVDMAIDKITHLQPITHK